MVLDRDALALRAFGFDAGLAQQPGDAVLAAGDASLVQGPPGLHAAVGLAVFNVYTLDSDEQLLIGLHALARRTRQPGVKSAARARQELA